MDAVALGLPLLIALIAVALLFDFLNGLHDAANSIATIVSTRVLRPQYAVAWAAFFNFIAFLFFGLHVAQTIGTGVVGGGVAKTSAAIVLSPLVGFALALLLTLIVSWLFVRATPFAVDRKFRMMQFVSASLYSLGHGGNDAQKTMGIIAVLLYSQGYMGATFHIPFWVVLSCQAAMGLGTFAGGWRIVKTMGSKIPRLTPVQGFCAETVGAITLVMPAVVAAMDSNPRPIS